MKKAKRIIDELDKAAKEGKGAAQLDGRMIDAASARMAENIAVSYTHLTLPTMIRV